MSPARRALLAIGLSLLSALFFTATYVFNRAAAVEGGHWAWTAALRYLFVLPLLLVNFVESNPGPVKFAMAAMGLCEEVYRLPMVPPRPAAKERILAVLSELGIAAEAATRA